MTSISKNVNIDKWDHIANKSNNIYHWTIKMIPINVKPSMYINFRKKIIRSVLNLKLVIMLEYQNIKMFLQKAMFQICLKKFLWLKKLKRFTKKKLQKSNQKEFRGWKVNKDKRQ